MSLRVWLPLISDNHNQGLMDLTATNVGTVSFIDGGKLGKCLSAGNGTQITNGISYNSNLVSELGDEYSCAIWVKPLGNHVHYNGTFVSSGNWDGKCWSFGVSQNNSQVDVFCSKYNTYITCEVPVNTWTHLACSCKNGTVKLYKNGEYVGERAVGTTLSSDASNFTVGRETYANGYFSFNGNLNDLRIYNHALSPREVELLSRGLVVHYPLNGNGRGGDNIMPNSYAMKLGTSSAANGVWRLAGTSNMTRSRIQTESGYYAFQNSGIQTANDGSCYGIDSFTFKANTTYTMSMSARIISGTEGYAGFAPHSVTITGGTHTKLDRTYYVTPLTTNWKRIYITFTTNSSTSRNIYIGVTTGSTDVTTQMALVKIEEGDKCTPWIPKNSDTEYSTLGYDSTTEYDVSGNRYDGSMIGTFDYDNDSARYSVSTKYSGTNYISLTSPSQEVKTATFWAKWNSIPTGQSILFLDYKSRMGFGLVSNGILCGTHTGSYSVFSKTGLVANTWYHFAIVNSGDDYTSTERKLYINGIEQTATSAKNVWSYYTDQLQIGKRSNTSDGFNGKMSDFRLYATALSEDDIKELYHTSASVDNHGNMFAYEYIEN